MVSCPSLFINKFVEIMRGVKKDISYFIALNDNLHSIL